MSGGGEAPTRVFVRPGRCGGGGQQRRPGEGSGQAVVHELSVDMSAGRHHQGGSSPSPVPPPSRGNAEVGVERQRGRGARGAYLRAGAPTWGSGRSHGSRSE
jgi:hypothetical protein